MTTTIEPAKLALLREHARQTYKSLGQLADEYVEHRFSTEPSTEEGRAFDPHSRPKRLPSRDGS